MGKGEIGRYEQFLLFSVFSSLALQTPKNQGLFGKGLKLASSNDLWFTYCLNLKMFSKRDKCLDHQQNKVITCTIFPFSNGVAYI